MPREIMRPPCDGASEVTASYLDATTRFTQGRRGVVPIDIPSPVYHALGPLAARHGMSITTFVARLCEAAIDSPHLLERPFS